MEDTPSACGSGLVDTDTSHISPEKIHAPASAKPESVVDGLLLGENSRRDMDSSQSAIGSPHTTCVIGIDLLADYPKLERKPLFLSKNWRDALCRCERCTEFYKQKSVGFLVDREDSIVEYERMGKRKREEKLQQQEGAELNLFNNLGHVEKIEILNGIADIKDELRTFLVMYYLMMFTFYPFFLCIYFATLRLLKRELHKLWLPLLYYLIINWWIHLFFAGIL